jgi:hypothetical protein
MTMTSTRPELMSARSASYPGQGLVVYRLALRSSSECVTASAQPSPSMSRLHSSSWTCVLVESPCRLRERRA